MNVYRKLTQGGGFSLPYLLHIYNESINIYVINDNKDLKYKGQLYKASAFDYTAHEDGSAALDIEIVEANNLINLVESSKLINVDAVGVVLENGAVYDIESYKHRYCVASWDGVTLSLKLESDDRLKMTFPALIFNTYNSRG